jgi:hypothetical protein
MVDNDHFEVIQPRLIPDETTIEIGEFLQELLREYRYNQQHILMLTNIQLSSKF